MAYMKKYLKQIALLVIIVSLFVLLINIFKNKEQKQADYQSTEFTETTENTESMENSEPEATENTEFTEPTEPTGDAEKDTEIEPTEETKEELSLISLGEFRLTAYCPCKKCCGKWSGGATASGVMPVANHTIAVDTNVIPFGTKIVIYGKTYVAEDTGSGIKDKCIDIYFNTHQEALEFGLQYAEVFLVID